MTDAIFEIKPPNTGTAKLVYILYIVSVVFGVTGIAAVILAYVYKDDAPEWLQSHYRFQIRTFWIGGLYLGLGLILSLILIGYLVLLLWVIWLLVRCIKGFRYLDQQRTHPNPTGWLL
jgi:uncharacterized membrane protein